MARTTGKRKEWDKDGGSRPGHRKDSLRGPGRGAGSDFQSRGWKTDIGAATKAYLGNPDRHAPAEPSKPQNRSMSPKDYRGRYDDGVTDDRVGGFANHTDDYDSRAKSYHRLGGTSGAGFQFKGVRGY